MTATRLQTFPIPRFPGLAALLLAAGCAASPANVPPATPPLAITASRPIEEPARQTFTFPGSSVLISSELEGGRVNAARLVDDSTFTLLIRPENAPINNSAWYAFKVWSATPRQVLVRLTYENGSHRYWPETRRTERAWAPLDSGAVREDTVANTATLRLAVGPDTLWVAGQPLITSAFFRDWIDSLAALPQVHAAVIGASPRGRPLHRLEFGAATATRHVMLIGRQHPPEATGTLALVRFVEELAGETPLARDFREHFRVHVVPLVNPDGVDLGHWRHNTGGVDLNRDWIDFRQPETRIVRDALLSVMARPGDQLWFAADFHSTQRDVFYTLDRTLPTVPPGVIDEWLRHIADQLPNYTLHDAPSGLANTTARNWFYREFGATALTYEVGDFTPHDLVREVAATAAQGTMRILLRAVRSAR